MSQTQYGIITKASVLSVALLLYTTSMTTPGIALIAKAFPDVSADVVKQIAALPSLMGILGSLLTGQLVRFMNKKTILYIAMTLQFFGGILPAFYGDMTFILTCRSVFGIGYGMIFPISASLIADLFEGRERDGLMGYKGAVGAAAGVVFQMLGGYLALISWRYVFLGFLLVIPIFLFILLKLPEPEKKPAPVASTGESQGGLSALTWIISILNVGFNIFQFSFMTNVAIVMAEGKIGNAAQAGMVLTVFTIGAFFAGLLYGKISQIFKKYAVALAVGLIGAAFALFINADTYILFLIAGLIFGLGFGIYNPEVTLRVIGSAHKSAATLAVSVYVAMQGVGQFLSPIALGYVRKAAGLAGARADWYVAAPTLLVACVALVLVIAFTPTKGETTTNM